MALMKRMNLLQEASKSNNNHFFNIKTIIMNKLKLLSLLLVASFMLFISSCGEDDPPPTPVTVGFKYAPENPIAGDLITFTNASNGGSTFAWDFGDETTSTDKNPTHTYTKSGKYSVVLKVDDKANQTFTKEVEVADALPSFTYTPDPIQVGIEVTFTSDIYNPENADVEYTWTFDTNNAIGAELDDAGSVTADTVTVRFINPNAAEPVSVTAKLNDLEYTLDGSVDVKAQLATTLFIAEKGGDIYTKKLYTEGVSELIDLGVESGSHPLTLNYSGDRLYVLDAGEIIKYSAENETTPGKIFSMANDGSEYKTHLTFGLAPYDDCYFGSVVGDTIYFTDRRNDVTAIPTSLENAEWGEEAGNDGNPEAFPHLVKNNELAYYSAYRNDIDGGPSYGWGALNGTFTKHNGLYYWAKNSNHKGLYIFSDNDIGVTDVLPSDPGESAILFDYTVRSFVIDGINQKIYFSSNKVNPGFYVCDLDGNNVTMIDDSPFDSEGGGNEQVAVTGIALDYETGYVYWAYRGPADADTIENPLQKNGIKKFKLDGSSEVEYLIENIEAYGIAVDPNKK